MCGIVGLLVPPGRNFTADLEEAAVAMRDRLAPRGPDDAGLWCDREAGIALGHRRLSVLDLSPQGHQPMASPCRRYVIVYNGEIYNHATLRAELESAGAAPAWRGHSDTEVLLAAITRWGVAGAVRRAVGMFAFALWDRGTRTLHLGRDRVGEKPLYYGWVGRDFLFASQPQAFFSHPAWQGEVDRDVLALFLRHGYIPSPHCIFKGFFKLSPGTVASIGSVDLDHDRARPVREEKYWDPRQMAREGEANPFSGSDEEAVETLDVLLRQAVRQQMVADVPLGAFLSGGIDSSTVVALMQAQSSRPVRTFTIGFREAAYSEAVYARQVARHFGTDHTELEMTPQEACDVLSRMPSIYDEPFADPSQLPTFLLCRLTRGHVTVSLSGDGGDELFAGYNNYFLASRIWDWLRRVPPAGRRLLAGSLKAAPAWVLDAGLGWMKSTADRYGRSDAVSIKMKRLAEVMNAGTPAELYTRLISVWKSPQAVVAGATEPETVFSEWCRLPLGKDLFGEMSLLDLQTYLPDDILVKVDRAAMGVSLETRIPLLDHRVVEFAWRLPLRMKVRDGKGKWLLRQVLARYLPGELIDRPKMGFSVPVTEWLRGPLREWAEGLLAKERLDRQGLLLAAPIRRCWEEHLSGRGNWTNMLWTTLMFQAWLDGMGKPVGKAGARPGDMPPVRMPAARFPEAGHP